MTEVIEEVAGSLIAINGGPLSTAAQLPDKLQSSYRYFLSICEGGYTQDHFYHFFGQNGPRNHNLTAWNEDSYWKKYFGLATTDFVFAEDALGTQFYFDIRGNRRVVKMLIPATGSSTLCANSFEEFLDDEVVSIGTNADVRELVRRFRETKRQDFRPFTHLSCKTPVVLGGSDSDLENLEVIQSSTNLKLLGQLQQQIADVPAGTVVKDIEIDQQREEIKLIFGRP
jgi:hypothetical protein